MFKFILISVLLAVAQADIDMYLGRVATVAISSNILKWNGCPWSIVTKVDVPCTCGNRTDVSLLSFKLESSIVPEKLFAVAEMNSLDEVMGTLKIEKCKCGDAEYFFGAFKDIDNTNFMSYAPPMTPNATVTAFLNVRDLPTQEEFEKFLNNNLEFKGKTDYTAFCGFH